MRQYVPDTQCGFRLYWRDEIPFISTESTRYAESEILLHVAARGILIDACPIAVIYRDEKAKSIPCATRCVSTAMITVTAQDTRRAAAESA